MTRSQRSRRSRWPSAAWLVAVAVVAAACGGGDSPATGGGKPGAGSGAGAGQGRVARPSFPAGTPMARLQSAGRLRVGTKFDQPLFGLNRLGKLEGFDVEIAKAVAQGIFGGTREEAAGKIQFSEAPSKLREALIAEDKVDLVVATYTINDARKQQVDFAGPYYVAGQDIMVKKADSAIQGVEDLNGRKVCSVQGSTSIETVRQKAPRADLSINFDTYSKCAEALGDGRVEAVTTDFPILLGLALGSNGAYKVLGRPFTEEPYGIGLKKGDQAFRDFLNDRLERIFANGEWAAAFERTVGTAGVPTPEPPRVVRY